MELEVHQGFEEEVYRDIVRIPEAHRIDQNGRKIPEGEIRKITVGKKSAFVVLRGDQGTTKPIMRMDDRTRDSLGLKYLQTVDVEFTSPVFRHWRWALSATEIGYRVASRIAVISFFLGLLGLVLGIVGLVLGIIGLRN